jgi:DnaJ-domain-containing protein 1
LNLNDERLRETIRIGREHGETLKDALGAAWRGAAEEWRAAAEERASGYRVFEERVSGRRAHGWRDYSARYTPKMFPLDVLTAYNRLGLDAGSSLEDVRRRRRELIKRCHPDRFVDPGQRKRAERLTAEINAAHDTIEHHLLRR